MNNICTPSPANATSRWARRAGIAALAVALSMGTFGMSGCGSDAQSGALLGAGVGALGGAVVGHNQGRRTAEGAGIGAGIGAVAGYMIGNESDKAKQRQRHYYHY